MGFKLQYDMAPYSQLCGGVGEGKNRSRGLFGGECCWTGPAGEQRLPLRCSGGGQMAGVGEAGMHSHSQVVRHWDQEEALGRMERV